MNSFHYHRFLLLSNGFSIGIFVHSLSYVYLVISADGSFVQISDTNVQGSHAPTVHLTRFLPKAYKSMCAKLLTFRNRHSCRPYCTQEFHGERSTLYGGDHGVRWRPNPTSLKRVVHSEKDPFIDLISKIVLCPLRKRVLFETVTTYYTENVLGNDNLKEEMCTLVQSEYALASCPDDLRSLVHVLLHTPSSPESDSGTDSESHSPPPPHTVFLTNTVSSTPLGARHAPAALDCFQSLSGDLTLLRDINKYPSCEGGACVLVEQLDSHCDNHGAAATTTNDDDTPHYPERGGFSHSTARNWRGCSFVLSSLLAPPAPTHATKRDAAWRLQMHQSTEVQAWLSEAAVRSGGVGGVISLRADMVHLQLYALLPPATSRTVCASNNTSTTTNSDDSTATGTFLSRRAGVGVDSPQNNGGAGKKQNDTIYAQADFTIHLCVFEAYMMNDDSDYDCEDEYGVAEGEEGKCMSWSRLTAASLQQLGSVDLALRFKQVVLHLIVMRTQVEAFAQVHSLPPGSSRSIGLVYHGQQSRSHPLLLPSSHHIKNMSLEKYDPDIPRQFQYKPVCSGSNTSRLGLEECKQSWEDTDPPRELGQDRCCSVVLRTGRDDRTGRCFTLMGDGTTRGVFRKDSMLLEYLPDLQVVRTVLRDGSERVLSVAMLLQLATSTSTGTSKRGRSARVGGSTNEFEEESVLSSVAQNVLHLLAFRRFAVLPDEKTRLQLGAKEQSVSVSVMIAQMRNANYLNRNLSKK